MSLSWYVVQAQPRKEPFVCERIGDLGRETFLPLIHQRVAGRRRSRLVPLFPSYVFARLSAGEGDLPRVRWAHGVRRLLGEGEVPRPVDDALIDCIRARADRAGRVKLGRRLRPGARVRIVGGPLAGLIGVLERPLHSPERRVSVLLEVFQRMTRVEVPAHAVWGEAETS
jgi:transcription antitermination factor NusG